MADAGDDAPGRAKFTIDELAALEDEVSPFVRLFGFVTEEIGFGTARVRLPYNADHIRAGGTISGPAMMALADYAMYVALLGALGNVPLAVTTNLNINFLRKPAETDLLCDAALVKLGRRLAVGEMRLHSERDAELCAHVTATYSIPPGHGAEL